MVLFGGGLVASPRGKKKERERESALGSKGRGGEGSATRQAARCPATLDRAARRTRCVQ